MSETLRKRQKKNNLTATVTQTQPTKTAPAFHKNNGNAAAAPPPPKSDSTVKLTKNVKLIKFEDFNSSDEEKTEWIDTDHALIVTKETNNAPAFAASATIQEAWATYTQSILAEGKSAYAALLQTISPLFSEGKITIELSSEVQKMQLANFENQFKSFVKNKYKNDLDVEIAIVKNKDNATKKSYLLPKEIVKAMNDENPMVVKFIQELGLDFDYNS